MGQKKKASPDFLHSPVDPDDFLFLGLALLGQMDHPVFLPEKVERHPCKNNGEGEKDPSPPQRAIMKRCEISNRFIRSRAAGMKSTV